MTQKLQDRAIAPTANNGITKTVATILTGASMRKRFEEILGKKAAGFISSVINVTKGSQALSACDPDTVVAAAAIAATLDLPIDPNLGFAYLVPYKNHGKDEAQFQLGYRGYIQLALRTGQYRTINVGQVYDGELLPATPEQRLKGRLQFAALPSQSPNLIGYAAYFELVNGAEKWDYMTVEDVRKHAQRFSQSYRSGHGGPWQTDFDAMARKTVLKRLLSHYGILSIEMQTAILAEPSETIPQSAAADGNGVIDVQGEVRGAPATEDGRAIDPATGEVADEMSPEARAFFNADGAREAGDDQRGD